MKKILLSLCLAAASLATMAPLPAMADRGGRDYHGHEHGHGHSYGHYGRHSEHSWRGGSWYHGSHLGRIGWWWIVDGFWYPYANRSNAYPVYQDTVVIEQPVQQQPQTIIVQQPVPVQQQPVQVQQPSMQYPQSSLPPPGVQQPVANMWYYCDASRMYYPYVNSCASGWRAVSPVPPTGAIR